MVAIISSAGDSVVGLTLFSIAHDPDACLFTGSAIFYANRFALLKIRLLQVYLRNLYVADVEVDRVNADVPVVS